MIYYERLKIGDVVCTTSGSPLAAAIKMRTWGITSAFSQSKASHIATVVERGHGLLYFAEMLPKGLDLTEISSYDHAAPLQHICAIRRHPLLSQNADLRIKYNNAILALHARKVKYGYDDLFNYIGELVGIQVRDKESTLICSELPRVGLKAVGVVTPDRWSKRCSPMDWQCWSEMEAVKWC